MLKRLKKLWWLALVPFGLAALAAGMLQSRDLRAELVEKLRETTGLEVLAKGQTSFAFLPKPHLRLEQVEVRDSSGGLSVHAQAVAVRGNLRLLSLLAGMITFDKIELVRPDIVVDFDLLATKPGGLWAEGEKTPEKWLANLPPGFVAVQGARIMIKGGGRPDLSLADVSFKFDWPQRGGPLALNGRGRWQELPVSLAAWMANPAQFAEGGASAVTLVLRSGQARATWRGMANSGLLGQFSGDFVALAPSLAPFLGSDGDSGLSTGAEKLELRGNLVASLREQSLSRLRLNVLGSDFEGAAVLRHGGAGMALAGTLASENLDLSPLLVLVRHLALTPYDDARPSDGALPTFAIDLRLSAAKAATRQWNMQDVAIALRAQPGKLTADLAQANVFGGTAQGQASLSQQGSVLEFAMRGGLSNIDLSAACGALRCTKPFSGTGDLVANAKAIGKTPTNMMETLAGEGQATFVNPVLPGIDLAQALRRVEKHSWPALALLHEGRSAFDSGAIRFDWIGTHALVREAVFAGNGIKLEFAGKADFAGQLLLMDGTAIQLTPDKPARGDGPVLKFRLEGPWEKPSFTPDLRERVHAAE